LSELISARNAIDEEDSSEESDEESDEDSSDESDEEPEKDSDEESTPESTLLLRTLTSAPHLGHFVRRLILLTHNHEYDVTLNHIEILSKCPFLEDLKILGYNGYLVKDYRKVLGKLHHLRTLVVSRYGLADRPTDYLGYQSDCIELLRKLPSLKHFLVATSPSDALRAYSKDRRISLIVHT
jgi:hypothetical protein